MKRYIPILLLCTALTAALLSIFGDESFFRLHAMTKNLENQRNRNSELEQQVRELKSTVRGLRTEERTLERTARETLGMARPDETIFVFEKKSSSSSSATAIVADTERVR